MVQAAGRFKELGYSVLEHAEHDRADKGECDVGGNNAQSADERTHEGHWERSPIRVAAHCDVEANKPFGAEKVSAAVARDISTAGDVVKEW
jgi:hypothetical protein